MVPIDDAAPMPKTAMKGTRSADTIFTVSIVLTVQLANRAGWASVLVWLHS